MMNGWMDNGDCKPITCYYIFILYNNVYQMLFIFSQEVMIWSRDIQKSIVIIISCGECLL